MVDIIPSGINTTATLSNSGDAYGRIDTPGDTDMYKVNLIAGNYHFNLGGDPAFGGALSDTILRVYNSSGHLIAVDDDNGAGSSSYLDLNLASGTYYVAVNGFVANTGDYLLNVELDTPHNGGIAGTLQPGMSLTNRIDATWVAGDPSSYDHDDFQLYVEAGVTYSVTLAPQPGVDGPNSNPIKPVENINLAIPHAGYSVGSSGSLTHSFTATSTGFITITSAGRVHTHNGYYTISVTSNAPYSEHRPSGANKTVTTYEDTSLTFSVWDFGITDADGDGLAAIYITSLPSKGSLTLDGQPVVVGQAISPHVLTSLRWTPPANANGSAVGSFDFTVMDTSERRAIDLTPNRITFSVLAVNDAPVITSGGGQASAVLAVLENRMSVTTATASDDSVVTYKLAGPDAALFTINATTGALSFRSGPDFESARDSGRDNAYDVGVLVTDGALTDTQALKIYVRNVVGNTVTGTGGNNAVDASHAVNGKAATVEEDYIDGKNGNDKLNGLTGNDTIIGGTGKDTLTGGAGFDRLDGGKDADRFVFSAKFNSAGVDTIVKFEHNRDKMALENKVFKALGSSLTSDEFYAKAGATAARDKSDHIVYDKATGNLYYDADGKGGAGAILFATLANKPTLDHGDFVIV